MLQLQIGDKDTQVIMADRQEAPGEQPLSLLAGSTFKRLWLLRWQTVEDAGLRVHP